MDTWTVVLQLYSPKRGYKALEFGPSGVSTFRPFLFGRQCWLGTSPPGVDLTASKICENRSTTPFARITSTSDSQMPRLNRSLLQSPEHVAE